MDRFQGFGPEACAPVKEKGDRAEAGRPKVKHMLDVADFVGSGKHAYVPGNTNASVEIAMVISWLEKCFRFADKLPANKFHTEQIIATPAQAEYILKNYNIDNRPIRDTRVAHWAREIRADRFILHSQGISFSRSRRLINGQHRLSGCVTSGLPITINVTFGESEEAFAVLDHGANRTMADTFQHEGVKHYSTCAAIARLLIVLDRLNTERGFIARAVGNNEGLSVLHDNPAIESAADDARRIGSRLKCASSGIGLGLFLVARDTRFAPRYGEFIERLHEGGEGIVTTIRDKLQQGHFRKRNRNSTTAGLTEAAATIRAWNGFIRGRGRISEWSPSEPFPKAE